MSAPEQIPGGGWTPDRVDLLRRHYAVGLTASESAILLGVSKNAVISKRSRLGLVGAVRPASKAAAVQARDSARVIRLPPETRFRRLPLPDMDLPPPAGADPKPLAARVRVECVWPLGPAEQAGDWRTLFCCAPIKPGGRYCPTHAARARVDAPPAGQGEGRG